ncbi:polymorphic toxin-type HINT domain-containing protein [Streptomyces pseudovenezuelae]|uniref:polymorphic toxin-type HINT domain-containing protein n=1 Tax=Streptomyces pseudovenezuelae TaxID=67350 RepID=UPI002E81CC87|nr:polymorphic toxin-type HINT domain-containing protein [Streptomyces pseudovenezuelae]WUA90623.1 polymorphic toxin-type HINT domain-containing protein [Streptomyces pseudovenezuelae]
MARAAVPVTAVALLVGLLPAQAMAIPPDPAKAEVGRETLTLEELEKEEPIPGKESGLDRSTLRAEVPKDQLEASANTTITPAGTAPVTFGSTTTTAAARTTGQTATQTALTPAGTLPVSLGQAAGQPAPTGTWQVTIPQRTASTAQGVDGAVIVVEAPVTGAVPISVKLDYAKFESLYGADWASRLRFVQFPDCYLTTPDDDACQTYEELETTNDPASASATATVDPAADGTVTPASARPAPSANSGVVQAAYRKTAQTAAAGSSTAVVGAIDSGTGGGGTFKATPLATDGKWTAGGSSGAFTFSYPLTVPEPPGGPAPQIAFNYNSQTVDGRTAVSSPQASWIGEGWSYDPGYIERRYRSCQDDRKTLDAGAPNNTAKKDKTSDLCWVSYNAVMSLGGKTTELVRDAPSGSKPESETETYRPQQDDGTRVEHRVGGTNDDNNGEYWVVTTTDGNQYYYGLNSVGGGHAPTNSVSAVPVFGNHPGEPCNDSAFADSRCGAGKQQAWRWGLDKVVDVHGNTMIVNWAQESNWYAVRKKFKTPEQYDRYAYPTSIEYGMRPDGLTKPSATVNFGVKQRCLKSDTACAATNFAKTDDPGAYRAWWDTPGNLNCKSTSKLCPAFPSFWTQLRLDTVTTRAARAGQSDLGPVDKYTLRQSFPEDWYDTAPGLWLNSITRTGYAPGDTTGTLQSSQGVSFAPYTVGSTSPLASRLKDRQLPGLVLNGKNDQRPGFTRPRIGVVSTESGGDVEVEYTGGCASPPTEDKGKANGTCYPVRWSPDGDEKTPAKAWFNKYVVDSVTEVDKVTSHGAPVTTSYSYQGPAWARSDDEFSRPSLRTYSDWRGYRQVRTTKGRPLVSTVGEAQTQSLSATRYFQGTGGEVKDSTGAYTLLADDAPQYAGMAAETITYRDSDGQDLKRILNYPWSKQTASRARENEDGTTADPLLAHRAGVKRTDEFQRLETTGWTNWRAVRTLTTVDDTYGLPIQVETAVVKPNGSGETLSDQTCTKTLYVHNTTAWLIGLPTEQRTTATSCSGYATADPATKLKASTRYTYDDLAYGATPTEGMVTSTAEIDATGTSHSVVTAITYDDLGRVRTLTRPGVGTTETQYTPAGGGPVTATTTINAKDQATTTTFDPGRGLAVTAEDPNHRVTRTEYDALGRLVKGWSASRSGGLSPNVMIAYQPATADPDGSRPAAVTVRTLKDDGSYSTGITLYDGLNREVQQQTEAHGPGRVIVDTTYDDHGLVYEQTSGYLAKGEPEPVLFAPRSKTLVPSFTKYRYDGMERQVRASVYYEGGFEYSTATTYGLYSVTVDPAGSTTPKTQTFQDALGRVTSVKHFTQNASDAGRTTSYEYDARGNRFKVTDPAGNAWTYIYDARGRMTSATDPDTGTTDTWYDAADRPNRVRDARGQETFTEYDVLGRVRYVRQGSATATPAKEYLYDEAPGGIGQPTSIKRHTDTGDYVSRVTGYDAEYHPTGAETVIPANSMTTGLSGTYAYAYTYTPTGKPLSVTLPAVGGLAREKVVSRYNGDGLPESTSGQTWYTSDATYSPYGEVLRTVSAAQPYRVWTTNFVDPHTGRLQRTVTDRETADPHRITDSYYSYDVAGTITSQARQLSDAAWDTQCFTYDVQGELVHAWTSATTPNGQGTGCKSANGSTWGPRTDYAVSSGPVTDAPDAAADTTTPDTALSASLSAAAPDAAGISTGGTAYRQSYTFDWLGNRATMTDGDTTYTYGYGTTVAATPTTPAYKAQPHTMAWISSNPSGKSSSYIYDAVGNTTDRDLADSTQSLTWTPENKLDTITDDGTKTTYVYDADGTRLLENSPSGSTLYLGETEITTNATGTVTKASRSYAQAGAPTVVRTTTNGSTTGHKLSVLIADQLGTANTSVDAASGQTVTRRDFKPYGEVRGAKPTAWPNKRSYLGVGVDDSATGLTHIGAREYDQSSGRFLSADPIIDLADPLQMNGYAYSSNSPVSFSDPTGLCRRDICGDGYPVAGDGERAGYTGQRKGEKPCSYCNGPAVGYNYNPAEVFPGVQVPVKWAGRDEFIRRFYNYVNTVKSTNGRLPGYLTDGTNPEGAANQLGYWGLNVCWAMKSCPQGVMTNFRNMSMGFGVAVSAIAGSPLHGAAEKPMSGGSSKRSAGGCTQCFLAGTDVLMADGTTKDIENIKLGDEVKATDPRTGETGPRKVTRLIITEHDKHFNELSIATEDGIEKLTATFEHPFWSPSEDDWVDAGALKPGMTLLTDEGDTVIVTGNRAFTKYARTYNLTVDDLHTYYVLAGETPVLVHNSNCGGRWRLGEDYSKPNKNGVAPSLSTMRKRFWKNEAAEPGAADQYGAANIGRMKRGSAPQRQRPDGSWESMELSHEPIPERDGGLLLTPRWPEDHAIMDPGGYRRLPPGY